MSQTFANTIDGNKIYADRAEHDAAGNDIQTTYATKSEVPAAQVQADWSEADSSAIDFIKNKPTNLVQDASYVHTDNNFTTSLKDKLDGIASGAEVNVQADWAEADSNADSYIKNKPTIPSVPVQGVEVDGTSVVNAQGVAEITMPTIPVTDVEVDGNSVVNASGVAEITMPTFTQAQADWTESDTSDPSYIQNKPTVKPIAAGTNITITEAQGNIVISASGGAAQQQADWNQTNSSAVDYIKNKPTIPAAQVQSNWAESNSGSVSYIQNKPAVLPVIAGTNVTITQDNNGVTISAAGGTQVQADWTESDSSDPSYIQNKPTLAAVATSGAYADLSGTPTLATVATTGDYDDLLNKPTIPAAPVQSNWNESDSASLAYIQNKPANLVQDASYVHTDNNFTTSLKDKLDGIASGAEVNVQANWTESDSSSDSYIQNKPTLAAVATSGAYADLSGTPTINNVPAVTSSDDNKVLKASYSGGVGSYSWEAESGGSDAVYVTWDDTQAGWDTMWTQVQAALSGNKDVFLKDGFCVAELVATNPTQVNFRGLANSTGVPPKITYNYYYLQSGFAHKDVQDQYVLPYPGSGSTGQLLGLVSSDDPPYREPGWVTVSPGPTYSAGTGIDITNNVISADTTVLATKSELPDGVPTVTSSDNNKVLKASYSGGVASYSWQNESGGGGGGSYTAGTGIDITNDVISVDTSVVATQTDLADKEDAFTVGTGLEMDTTGGVNTLQVETPMDIVAGPGIAIDNPDSDTLRVSVGTTFTQAQLDYLKAALGVDETVLYESTAGMQLHNGLQLPETLYNFERIRFYVASNTSNGTPVSVEVPIQVAPYPNGTIELFFTNGHDMPSNFKLSWKWKMTLSGTTLTLTLAQYWGQNGTTWTQGDNLNDSTVFKIVGVHRIANN